MKASQRALSVANDTTNLYKL